MLAPRWQEAQSLLVELCALAIVAATPFAVPALGDCRVS
jgi:hypothetical protein